MYKQLGWTSLVLAGLVACGRGTDVTGDRPALSEDGDGSSVVTVYKSPT